ncbi:uncharacterized protein C2845_PM07G35300 [Panicum miliaceum]|uniref:DUF295 domain-containing protein n=1 Tax=Panicum miliaceum TaxID=4540 RepID=A0A3L6SMU1_PANMI|nr:uncharacterized protein C2845_PM07G35300 [Panicum miliaceum]
MKSPQLFLEPASPQPHPSELRDWGHLPDLILGEVLQRLVPCLRSLSFFAATCPPVAPLRPRLRYGGRCANYFLLHAWSPLVIRGTVTSPLAAAAEWTHHRLPRAASFVASVVDFRGRVLGVTDRAQLLEFRCLDPAAPPDQEAVKMLTATGLPEASTFESWHFGPRLVVAGERLLLLLLMTDPAHRGATGQRAKVHKVSVHALHEMPDGTMGVFVDCAGRSAIACADAAAYGEIAGNCIYFAEMTFYRGDSQRYWRSPITPWWK